ncbi:MAG TPA: dihydrodipicolinate synthase family protein [Gemmatimonadaceae bacterium]|nr:dihydrodipicolinate synthase family protein [Gemmatimonadaceae bacterium]
MIALNGIFAPLVTPFAPNGDVDTTAFASNVRAHMDAGLSGVVIAGSTGEAALLDEAERSSLVEVARDLVPKSKLLIAGAGAESTRYAIRLAKNAAARGADAVLVVAPHYYSAAMTSEALLRHYRAVADGSPIPVILYNIPKYMHFAIPQHVVTELAKHPNIIGIKDSSGNREMMAGFAEAKSPSFSIISGSGALLQYSLGLGATGGILGVSLFAPSLALEVYSAMKRGDVAAATHAQDKLTPLHVKIVAELGVPGVKAALDTIGLKGGPLRSPLLALGPAERAEVVGLIKAAELAGV